VTLSTANGLSEGYRTRIDRLQLGDIVLRDVRALVAPGLHGDSAARHERPEQT
jgi:aspartyl protease family protein